MSRSWPSLLLVVCCAVVSVDGSYRYVGCYTHVFHDSVFRSSRMEPTLCFRLCNTPIVYLLWNECRCSGGGLMHHGRQHDQRCSFPCASSDGRSRRETKTCGGWRTYSAYVEDAFYIRHGHLFTYRIQLAACELWTAAQVSDTSMVRWSKLTIESSLNPMERCAATCLDHDAATKSIAFNDDDTQCACVISRNSTILPAASCDRYCNNSAGQSAAHNLYQCGSSTDSRVWSVYNLNGTCPSDFAFIGELGKCLRAHKAYRTGCPPPTMEYIYEAEIGWTALLKIIERMKLTNTSVAIRFSEQIIVNDSLRCSTDSLHPYDAHWSSNTQYVLLNGCVTDRDIPAAERMCVTNPSNVYSFADDDADHLYDSGSRQSSLTNCPEKWLDINDRCYRISSMRKPIQDAWRSCIDTPPTASSLNDESIEWQLGWGDRDSEDEPSDSPTGSIVRYNAQWQALLGFYLLDTDLDRQIHADRNEGVFVVNGNETDAQYVYLEPSSDDSSAETFNLYYEDLAQMSTDSALATADVNELQMIQPEENYNQSIGNESCLVSLRTFFKSEEKPMVQTMAESNCSKPRHVLCEHRRLVARSSYHDCFRKPVTMGSPILISNRLTYEICVTACRQLSTSLTVLHIDQCYCYEPGGSLKAIPLVNLTEHRQKTCGAPCPGNPQELCGDESTIVVIQNPPIGTYSNSFSTLTSLDFRFDGCVHSHLVDPSTFYRFRLNSTANQHPHHCLQLCAKYKQKYALISSDRCVCSSLPLDTGPNNITRVDDAHCSQRCAANYFYSCGHPTDALIYAKYFMRVDCRPGFEATHSRQQCTPSLRSTTVKSLSAARDQCDAMGAKLARVGDILELQENLPESKIAFTAFKIFADTYAYSFVGDVEYFWVNRTSDTQGASSLAHSELQRCLTRSATVDRNCLVAGYTQISNASNAVSGCIAESDRCSKRSARPVCVDRQLDRNSTVVLPWTGEEASVSVGLSYACDNKADYHLINEQCYKISLHEVTWHEARTVCERENATMFVPAQRSTVEIIQLVAQRTSYTSLGIAHIDVITNEQNEVVMHYNTSDEKVVPDMLGDFASCQTTSGAHDEEQGASTNQTPHRRIGCGYLDLFLKYSQFLSCDEKHCQRTAIVICQKRPNVKSDILKAERFVKERRDC